MVLNMIHLLFNVFPINSSKCDAHIPELGRKGIKSSSLIISPFFIAREKYNDRACY